METVKNSAVKPFVILFIFIFNSYNCFKEYDLHQN